MAGSEKLRLNSKQKDYLTNLIGADGMKVVRHIGKREVEELDIVETLKMKPTAVRRHLYKLYDRNLARCWNTRADNGWRTYFWRIKHENLQKIA